MPELSAASCDYGYGEAGGRGYHPLQPRVQGDGVQDA